MEHESWQLRDTLARGAPGAADQRLSCQAITACARAAQWQAALQVLADMDEAGLVPDVFCFSSAITACEKDSQWQMSLQLLSSMLSAEVVPNVISFNASISSCEKGGTWQKALLLMSQMLTGKVEPTVISFNASISACEKGGQWQVALHLLSQMPVSRVAPNAISWNAAISACEKSGEWQPALYLLSQMSAAEVLPDVISFNAGISACEKGGEWQMALSLLSLSLSARTLPNKISFSAGIQACANAREWRAAFSLWSEAESRGLEKDSWFYSLALDAVYTERIGFQIFREALAAEAWPEILLQHGAQLDLHSHSCGSAMLAVLWWLAEVVPEQLASGQAPRSFEIIPGWGKSRNSWNTSDIRAAVMNLLARCRIPSNIKSCNPGRLQVDLSGVDPLSLRAFFPEIRSCIDESLLQG